MLIHLRSTEMQQRVSSQVSAGAPPSQQTFNVSVPSTVITHAQGSTFLGLGGERRLKKIVHALVVDFKEGHPHGKLAAACFCQAVRRHWSRRQNLTKFGTVWEKEDRIRVLPA